MTSPSIPLRPTKPPGPGRRGWLVIGAAGALFAALIVVAMLLPARPPHTGGSEVKLVGCTVDRGTNLSSLKAVVEVRNTGSYARDYRVTVAFESADGSEQFGTAVARAYDLAPGQVASPEAVDLVSGPGPRVRAGLRCRVLR